MLLWAIPPTVVKFPPMYSRLPFTASESTLPLIAGDLNEVTRAPVARFSVTTLPTLLPAKWVKAPAAMTVPGVGPATRDCTVPSSCGAKPRS